MADLQIAVCVCVLQIACLVSTKRLLKPSWCNTHTEFLLHRALRNLSPSCKFKKRYTGTDAQTHRNCFALSEILYLITSQMKLTPVTKWSCHKVARAHTPTNLNRCTYTLVLAHYPLPSFFVRRVSNSRCHYPSFVTVK